MIRKLLPRLFRWLRLTDPPTERIHNGQCDRCTEYGMIWLDGVGIFCWKHYCEEMGKRREGTR